MFHRINFDLSNYPGGLEVQINRDPIYSYTPHPKPEPLDATGWAEAAFDPPSLKDIFDSAKSTRHVLPSYEAQGTAFDSHAASYERQGSWFRPGKAFANP